MINCSFGIGKSKRSLPLTAGLRALGAKYKCPVITGVQVAKDAWNSSDITLESVPESKAIAETADTFFAIIRTEEMKRQNSIVIMSLESNILKVVPGTGDALINIDINCNEKKEWMDLEYEAWCEKNIFNNIFTIKIINPYLYMVPFPVKPIIIRTIKKINNYVEIL